MGRHVLLDGVDHEVIGVMPRGFEFKWRRARTCGAPLPFDPASPRFRATFSLPFIRLRPGATRERVESAARRIVDHAVVGVARRHDAALDQQLAVGTTVFALDLGGGIELFPAGRTSLRVDVDESPPTCDWPEAEPDHRDEQATPRTSIRVIAT